MTHVLRNLCLALGLFAIVPLSPGGASSQVVDPYLWTTDGRVTAAVLDGNSLYIGGEFTYVGPSTGGFAAVDAATATVRASWPRVDGVVGAVAPDGSGGWYIGGSFSSVAGVARGNLAHIRADGTLDGWNPNANGIGVGGPLIRSLAVSGGTVYVGGSFTSVGGHSRSGIAALDATTGLATAWDPSAYGTVFALAEAGGTVYAGGDFSSIGGQVRYGIAALSATTGLATAWNPNPVDQGTAVFALALSGGTVFAGGSFVSIGGQPRNSLAALDATTGLALAWNPVPTRNCVVSVLAVAGGTIYAAGDFSSIGVQARKGLAALDATTGLATSWDPNPYGSVYSLAMSGSTVYAGGNFVSIGGQARNKIAALNATTGLATAWNPRGTGSVGALGVFGGTVFAGGDFSSIGGETRVCIAELDVTTGRPTAWNPAAYGQVSALAVSGGLVYAGGYFSNIGGQWRNGIAALDATTGSATAWDPNPGPGSAVLALVVSGGTVYAGGSFASIGGQVRYNLAALDAITGLATAWNPIPDPEPNTFVRALAVSGATVYAGGSFTTIGGYTRNGIASLDATTGTATAWNPNPAPYSAMFALTVSAGTVYASGDFTSIGGQIRNGVAALDATAGIATAWNPNPNGPVYALALSGSTVYAGGSFGSIGGQPRNSIAAVDATTGLATKWNPGVTETHGAVIALAVTGGTVYAGGEFTSIGGQPQRFVSQILPAPISRPSATVLSPNGGESVNIGAIRRLSWSANAPQPGVQSVDLYLSRNGAVGSWELLAAGAPNTGHYDWTVTGPAATGNCYLWVDARDYAGQVGSDVTDAGFTIGAGQLDVEDLAGVSSFALERVAPNPIRARADLFYAVPMLSPVRLTLLDVQGRLVATVFDGVREPGRYAAPLEAAGIPAGLYFARLQGGAADLRQRVVIVK